MVSLQDVYRQLLQAFGPQHWWPAESPFEVMIGAVLTQNTNWRNVERALDQLRGEAELSPEAIAQLSMEELAELIRPAGYYRVKARRLLNLVDYIMQQHGGSVARMFQVDSVRLREQLLAINGVGPETADSILLYAGDLPFFVVDAYTHRVAKRHAWVGPAANYGTLQQFFADALEADPVLFNEYHALVVKLGKEFCRKRPVCDGCPLQSDLPPGGPLEIA